MDEEDISNGREPNSIKQLNSNILENDNKIQHFQNEILAKNNLIENKLNQIKDDDMFLKDVEKERDIYIESMRIEKLGEIKKGSEQIYQCKLIKLILEHFFKISLGFLEDDGSRGDIFEIEKNRNLIFKEFKKIMMGDKFSQFQQKLKDLSLEFTNMHADLLREINQTLENLKVEAELKGRDECFEHFFYHLFKSMKLIIFILLGKIRIEKVKESIEKVAIL
jgi:hypothetical protein